MEMELVCLNLFSCYLFACFYSPPEGDEVGPGITDDTEDENSANQIAGKIPNFCVLLHGSLKVEGMVAVVQLGYGPGCLPEKSLTLLTDALVVNCLYVFCTELSTGRQSYVVLVVDMFLPVEIANNEPPHSGRAADYRQRIQPLGFALFNRPEWYGMLYSQADSKKKSNLMMSLFEPGPEPLPWLGKMAQLGPISGTGHAHLNNSHTFSVVRRILPNLSC